MVVECISESTRLDQEWCSKLIHSVETVVAMGSEYQVMLAFSNLFLAAALEAWLRWFNFVSGLNFMSSNLSLHFCFLTHHTLPFPQTKTNKQKPGTNWRVRAKNLMSSWYLTNFRTRTKLTKFLPVRCFLVRKHAVNIFFMISTLFTYKQDSHMQLNNVFLLPYIERELGGVVFFPWGEGRGVCCCWLQNGWLFTYIISGKWHANQGETFAAMFL